MTKIVFVRVNQRSPATAFFRCGMRFTKEWTPVEVDGATLNRLQEEQMLEVSETDPGIKAVDAGEVRVPEAEAEAEAQPEPQPEPAKKARK